MGWFVCRNRYPSNWWPLYFRTGEKCKILRAMCINNLETSTVVLDLSRFFSRINAQVQFQKWVDQFRAHCIVHAIKTNVVEDQFLDQVLSNPIGSWNPVETPTSNTDTYDKPLHPLPLFLTSPCFSGFFARACKSALSFESIKFALSDAYIWGNRRKSYQEASTLKHCDWSETWKRLSIEGIHMKISRVAAFLLLCWDVSVAGLVCLWWSSRMPHV